MEKAIKLFPRGRGRKITVPIPARKAVILTTTFTNPRFPQRLQEAGVPLITDTTREETKTKFLLKKTQISLRTGAGGTISYRTADRGTIKGIGMPLILNRGVSVSGTEILSWLCDIAKERGIDKAFLRIRQRVTEVGLNRPRKGKPKFTVKAYFIPPGKVDFKDKHGTKGFELHNLPKVLRELLEAAWFVHAWDNPDSLVIALTMRQPQGQPTHTLSLP